MDNLEQKSLTQKLKQNTKSIFYSLLILLFSGIFITYAVRDPIRITNIMQDDIQAGDKITPEWVRAVRDSIKF